MEEIKLKDKFKKKVGGNKISIIGINKNNLGVKVYYTLNDNNKIEFMSKKTLTNDYERMI